MNRNKVLLHSAVVLVTLMCVSLAAWSMAYVVGSYTGQMIIAVIIAALTTAATVGRDIFDKTYIIAIGWATVAALLVGTSIGILQVHFEVEDARVGVELELSPDGASAELPWRRRR